MIEARDLRKGNILQDKQGKKIHVESICEEGINVTTLDGDLSWEYHYEDLEGIPLTPEILEKCGFEKKVTLREEIVAFADGNREMPITKNFTYINWYNKTINLREDNNCFYFQTTKICSVHHLQNIYYWNNRREELEIKL